MQTLELMGSIPVIIFSSVIFADERNLGVLIPALIASLAIVWSHWEHNHFRIAKKTIPFFIWIAVTSPISASISKILLAEWNPISFELVRSGIMTLFIGGFFYKQALTVSSRAFYLMILTNILSAVSWILFYFSYQSIGIVYTLLVFSLEPLLIYFASIFVLKERLNIKKVWAFAVVLASIAVAHLIS